MSATPMPAPGGMPPGMPGGPGALPPALMGGAGRPQLPPALQTPDRTGGVTAPTAQMGTAVSGMALVHTAVSQLQAALSKIPMGTPFHTAVAKAIVDVSKHMHPDDKNQAVDVNSMANTLKERVAQGPQDAINRLYPQSKPAQPALPPAISGGLGAPPGGGEA